MSPSEKEMELAKSDDLFTDKSAEKKSSASRSSSKSGNKYKLDVTNKDETAPVNVNVPMHHSLESDQSIGRKPITPLTPQNPMLNTSSDVIKEMARESSVSKVSKFSGASREGTVIQLKSFTKSEREASDKEH